MRPKRKKQLLFLSPAGLWLAAILYGCYALEPPKPVESVSTRCTAPRGAPVGWEVPPVHPELSAVASFAVAVQLPQSDLFFSHQVHQEADIECSDCHSTDGAAAGMPTKETCVDCHDEADTDEQEPSPECLKCHARSDYKVVQRRAETYVSSKVRFDHEKHVALDDVDCTTCHGQVGVAADRAGLAGLPTMQACWSCHGSREASLECSTCHEGEASKLQPHSHELAAWRGGHGAIWARAAAQPLGSSARCDLCHEVQDCSSCHVSTPPAGHGRTAFRASHGAEVVESAANASRCALCHTKDSCQSCHEESKPASHQADSWMRSHGSQAAMAGSSREGCTLCHKESSCDECHTQRAPRNHNNFWRLQGHGATAAISRESCATCHQPDSCVRCHTKEVPFSHRGNFVRGQAATHCVTCHEPLQASSCSACHSQAAHATAPLQPIDPAHAVASEADCRTCHGLFSGPHPDNGACTSCHG